MITRGKWRRLDAIDRFCLACGFDEFHYVPGDNIVVNGVPSFICRGCKDYRPGLGCGVSGAVCAPRYSAGLPVPKRPYEYPIHCPYRYYPEEGVIRVDEEVLQEVLDRAVLDTCDLLKSSVNL